jgi:8-hydroxy-5-deazaflavin:NADPH oxidoreductase
VQYGVLGTGMVGQTIGSALVEHGHEVRMGSRQAGNEKAVEWASGAGDAASEGSFADAASFGEALFNCTAGEASLDALRAAGADNLSGKLLVDAANPLDFSQGMPPRLTVCNDDSLGEQIQREFADARVVKTLNTVSAMVMANPPDGTNIFVCGDDAGAKAQATGILQEFGWPADDIIDLGDISASRGAEMYLGLWIRMMGAVETPAFNIKIVR